MLGRAELREMGLDEEQINKILAEHSKDLQSEKNKSEGYKTDSLKVQELLKTIETMKKADAEKEETLATKDKDYENLQQQVAEMQKQLQQKELKAQLADKGITGENADKLIASLGSGSIDVDLLASIITERENGAVDKKVKELEGLAGNPSGSKAGSSDDSKTEDVKNVESISFGSISDTAQSTRDFYK